MSAGTEQKIREVERQDELLKTATNLVREMSEESLVRLYKCVKHALEGATPPTESEPEQETRASRKRRVVNGRGSYTDQSEALILSQKKGMTAREVANATGQKASSADGTLRYIANSRETIECRSDGKWYPVANAKACGPKVGAREAIVTAYEKNGNAPWATRDIAAALPDVKRGTLDKTLVGMRADGILVSCGSDPKGSGGLYKLANPQGGARAGLI